MSGNDDIPYLVAVTPTEHERSPNIWPAGSQQWWQKRDADTWNELVDLRARIDKAVLLLDHPAVTGFGLHGQVARALRALRGESS